MAMESAAQRLSAGYAVPATQLVDQAVDVLICVWLGLWVAGRIPVLFSSWTLPGFLATLCAGAAAGTAWTLSTVLLLAYILHRWRTRRSQADRDAVSAAESPGTSASAGDSNGRSAAAGFGGGRHSSRYSGRLWTMPVAALPASGAVEVFPPATVDQGGAAFEWQASCHKGALTLRAVTPAAAAGLPAKVRVPLAGCRVTMVLMGCRSKGSWWRKSPLQLASTNPAAPLWGGMQQVLLFAETGVAKEQWFAALSLGCEASSPISSTRAVRQAYLGVCSRMRARGHLALVTQGGTQAAQSSEPGLLAPGGLTSTSRRLLSTSSRALRFTGVPPPPWPRASSRRMSASFTSSMGSSGPPSRGRNGRMTGDSYCGPDATESRPTSLRTTREEPEPSANTAAADEPGGWFSSPTDQATLQGLNAWLTRAAFEMLSSSTLQQKFKAGIQAKLGDMKRPAFLQQLQLLSLDMGNLPPVVSDVRVCAEAGAGGALVPQLRVRLTYQGCIKLLVEAQLDLRKGITMFAAPSAAASANQTPAGSSAAAPMPATAAAEQAGVPQQQQEAGAGSGGAPAVEETQAGLERSSGRAAATAGVVGSRACEDAEESALDSSLQEQVAQTMRHQQQASATNGKQKARQKAARKGASAAASGSSKAGAGGGALRSLGNSLAAFARVGRAVAAAAGLSQLEALAAVMPTVGFKVAVEVKALEVSLLLWLPPPPSDRLWVSCLQQPKVSLTVTPIVTQAVPQLLEGFQAPISTWVQGKLTTLPRTLQFPAAFDIKLPAFGSPLDTSSRLQAAMALNSGSQVNKQDRQRQQGAKRGTAWSWVGSEEWEEEESSSSSSSNCSSARSSGAGAAIAPAATAGGDNAGAGAGIAAIGSKAAVPATATAAAVPTTPSGAMAHMLRKISSMKREQLVAGGAGGLSTMSSLSANSNAAGLPPRTPFKQPSKLQGAGSLGFQQSPGTPTPQRQGLLSALSLGAPKAGSVRSGAAAAAPAVPDLLKALHPSAAIREAANAAAAAAGAATAAGMQVLRTVTSNNSSSMQTPDVLNSGGVLGAAPDSSSSRAAARAGRRVTTHHEQSSADGKKPGRLERFFRRKPRASDGGSSSGMAATIGSAGDEMPQGPQFSSASARSDKGPALLSGASQQHSSPFAARAEATASAFGTAAAHAGVADSSEKQQQQQQQQSMPFAWTVNSRGPVMGTHQFPPAGTSAVVPHPAETKPKPKLSLSRARLSFNRRNNESLDSNSRGWEGSPNVAGSSSSVTTNATPSRQASSKRSLKLFSTSNRQLQVNTHAAGFPRPRRTASSPGSPSSATRRHRFDWDALTAAAVAAAATEEPGSPCSQSRTPDCAAQVEEAAAAAAVTAAPGGEGMHMQVAGAVEAGAAPTLVEGLPSLGAAASGAPSTAAAGASATAERPSAAVAATAAEPGVEGRSRPWWRSAEVPSTPSTPSTPSSRVKGLRDALGGGFRSLGDTFKAVGDAVVAAPATARSRLAGAEHAAAEQP